MNPVVEAAWIEAIGMILSSLIASAVAGWFGKRWLDQERLQKNIQIAQNDIMFLLEVEKQYIEQTRSIDQIPGKNSVRETVRQKGYAWSGLNTPGRIKGDKYGF